MSRLFEQFTVGNQEIIALSDGAPERALGGFFAGVDPALWTAALGIAGPDEGVPFNFGTFLIRSGGRNILIDSGYGTPAKAMGIPGGGELPQRLGEVGLTRGGGWVMLGSIAAVAWAPSAPVAVIACFAPSKAPFEGMAVVGTNRCFTSCSANHPATSWRVV